MPGEPKVHKYSTFLNGLHQVEIKYALQKTSQNDQKTHIFEYKVHEKTLNSNLRRPSVRNFEYTEL